MSEWNENWQNIIKEEKINAKTILLEFKYKQINLSIKKFFKLNKNRNAKKLWVYNTLMNHYQAVLKI